MCDLFDNTSKVRNLEVQILLSILKRTFKEIEKSDKHYDVDYCLDYMKQVLKKNKITYDSLTGKILLKIFKNIKKVSKDEKRFNIVEYLDNEIKDLQNDNDNNDPSDDDLSDTYSEKDSDNNSYSETDDSEDEDYTTDDEYMDEFLIGMDDDKNNNLLNFIKLRYNKESIRNDVKFFKEFNDEDKENTLNLLEEINIINKSNKPLVFKILESNMSMETKANVIDKIKKIDISESGENNKIMSWIDNLLKVPFGEYQHIKHKNHKHKKYIKNAEQTLNEAIYGHDDAKRQILQILAQNINNPETNGVVFGIQGPIGNGKTTLIKEGLSKILNKPFTFISLGGATDGCFLDGHSFTYEGSIYGKIVSVLMESKCMNPVIYFDELDKVSETHKGDEIINILIHLTDPSQNSHFNDKYYQNIDFDLSKATIVFSYNDFYKINPVLRDRILNIKTKSLKTNEKIIIAKDYLLPKIITDVGIHNITIPDNLYELLIESYTNEGGVRKLKELLYQIMRELNLRKVLGNKIPHKLTKTLIIDDLLVKKPIITKTLIKDKPYIGYVNGLYASNYHNGGITCIETKLIPSDNTLQLKLTGQQGDVMKESMNVALTVAWNYIPEKTQKILLQKFKSNGGNMGIHIHCPEGATPKDGPSAGLAITLSIISLLMEIPIKHTIAITGEIDLNGNAMEIGGLEQKIMGAIQSGVKTVLCPFKNKKDLDIIKLTNPDINADIKLVKNINEVVDICLMDHKNKKSITNKTGK